MELNEEKVALLRRIQDHWRKFPATYYQGGWGKVCYKSKSRPCGTMGCIAGWVLIFSGYVLKKKIKFEAIPKFYNPDGVSGVPVDPEITARTILGLDRWEARTLFHGSPGGVWPSPFGIEWAEAELNSKSRKKRTGRLRRHRLPVHR